MLEDNPKFHVTARARANELQPFIPSNIDAYALMIAFGTVESGAGVIGNRSRFEPSYSGNHYKRLPKGTSMFEKSAIVRDAFETWGDSAAMSYGIFQVMYTTALFLNVLSLADPPEKLREHKTNFDAFIAMIKYICKSDKTISISQIADAYNSGTYKDVNIPVGYIDRILKVYLSNLG